MTPSWWEIAFGVASIAATITIPWAAASGAGQKRRGEQAQISFILARELREMKAAEDARQYSPRTTEETRVLIERMDAAAKFMAAEYSNSVLRTRAERVFLWLNYGALITICGLFVIYQSFNDDGWNPWVGFIMTCLGGALLMTGFVLWGAAVNKRFRLKSAGVPVPSLWATVRNVYWYYRHALIKRRLGRE